MMQQHEGEDEVAVGTIVGNHGLVVIVVVDDDHDK
jgi:hypothetical protein